MCRAWNTIAAGLRDKLVNSIRGQVEEAMIDAELSIRKELRALVDRGPSKKVGVEKLVGSANEPSDWLIIATIEWRRFQNSMAIRSIAFKSIYHIHPA
jgi:hypothetical protein